MITRRDFIKGMGIAALIPFMLIAIITNGISNYPSPECVEIECPYPKGMIEFDYRKCKIRIAPCKWEAQTVDPIDRALEDAMERPIRWDGGEE